MPVEIIQGDFVTTNIDASLFDVQITDPPYSMHVHSKATSQSLGGGTRHRDLGFDHLSFELRIAIAEAAASVKRWSLIYSDVEGVHSWIDACKLEGAHYIRTLPWIRWAMPSLAGDRPPQGFETIVCFWGAQKGRKSWNGLGSLVSLNHKCLRGAEKHKCEKPLDQALDLVSWFSNPGDRVLDPCAGSGTVGLACRILGREYVGYEIDVSWAAKATERLAREKLSDRDQERYERWLVTQETYYADKARHAENTAKYRAKLEASNARHN